MIQHLPQAIHAKQLLRRMASSAAMLFALCLAAPTANAQWSVNDADANRHLSNIEGKSNSIESHTDNTNRTIGNAGDDYQSNTVNGRLDAINRKLVIGTYDEAKPGPRLKDPDKALPASSSAALDDGASCNTVAPQQKTTCQDIVALQNAQYKYMLTMYENTNTRDAMLRSLLAERKDIKDTDPNQYGKLEDNTNKLTALYNLIQLDYQQMQTVNYAYEANIRYLQAKQTLAANAASTGKNPSSSTGGISIPGIGSISLDSVIQGLATGAALELALKGAQSDKPAGMKTLGVGESNGF
ncbi:MULTISPECIES: hypothetical protein [unclassified Luteibacter]|uniref:hypothetical protein n=1 Tax=Luteibacter sp. PvP019 TaxID=3156436 RepID=UPI003390FFA4